MCDYSHWENLIILLSFEAVVNNNLYKILIFTTWAVDEIDPIRLTVRNGTIQNEHDIYGRKRFALKSEQTIGVI